MGGKLSFDGSRSFRSPSVSWCRCSRRHDRRSLGYGHPSPSQFSGRYTNRLPVDDDVGGYDPHMSFPPPLRQAPDERLSSLRRTHSTLVDTQISLEEVNRSLAQLGLQSPNLVFGIDFTKSNEWTGKHSFNGRNLHEIGDFENPYQQVISVVARALSSSPEKNSTPFYGFGDASTHDKDVFSFHPDGQAYRRVDEALSRYKEIAQHITLSGPTSFAPIIEMAIAEVKQSGGAYHVLFIIADGQITRSVDTSPDQLSYQEEETANAIVQASEYPLSIFWVGVGDGPWDCMGKEFKNLIRGQQFDNFKFINFTEIMSKNIAQIFKEMEFAHAVSSKILSQYQTILDCGILGIHRIHNTPNWKLPARVPLSTPTDGVNSLRLIEYHTTLPTIPPDRVCPICVTSIKDMAFGCGHQTCCKCGYTLETCPICRSLIYARIKLY